MTSKIAATTRSVLAAALVFSWACMPEDPGSSGSGGRQGGSGGASSQGSGGAVGTGGSSSGTGGSVLGTGGAGTGGAGTGGASGTGGSGSGGAGMGGRSGGGDGGRSGGGGRMGGGGAAGGTTGGTGGATGGSTGAGGSPLPPTMDYSALGPFTTTSQSSTGPGNAYTIVRPATLGQNGLLHAPITFGPGIDMQPNQLMGLLTRFASHGFVVISTRLEGAPNAASNRMEMTSGLDWLIEQNSTAGSVFQGKLDVKKAVAMGYSVGGTAAVEVGAHEAVATVVSIHGHSARGDLHGPMLLVGGTADLNGSQSWLAPTYANSMVQTMFALVMGANHGYIQGTVNNVPGGVETPAIIAWMRYWIYNDQGARNYFYGDDCVMCKAPWTMTMRKNWQ